jgi:hypothetical protein
MADVAKARESSSVQTAKARAPQAFAHAEQLRKRAEEAFDNDDVAGAQILSERAMAAYSRAVILARGTQAEGRLADATSKLAKAEQEQRALDEQHKRFLAEAEDLELRAKVIRDAEPLPQNAPASPERERARFEAAAALATQARLLCTSARLLEPARESVVTALQKVQELDTALASKKPPAPIDRATELRSTCLRELTLSRRPQTAKNPASGAADALLSELSNAGFTPFRDDRGVVVTLRSLFEAGDKLNAEGQKRLEELGRVAKAHGDFPVLVVLHRAKAGTDESRIKRLVDVIKAAGVERVEGQTAGTSQPVLKADRAGAAERNDRVEFVFIAPSS